MISRRQGLKCLSAFPIYALLGEGILKAATLENEPAVRRWIEQHRELANGLKANSISQTAWNDGVEQLSREVDLPQLMAALAKLPQTTRAGRFEHDPVRRNIQYIEDGQLMVLPYEIAIVQLLEGQFLAPHAHRHVASVNLVVEGSIRIRTWDQISDERTAIRARPRSDDLGEVGFASSTTTARSNVHWFAPRSPKAAMVAISIGGVGLEAEEFDIFPVDVTSASDLGDGTVSMPVISWDEVGAKYTADM